MGIENMTGGTLYIMGEDGQRHLFATDATAEFVPSVQTEPKYVKRIEPKEATLTIQILNKRVSRKRFVKKLMAGGVPRNVAATIAKNVRCTKETYGSHLWLMQVSGYLRPCGG